MKTLSKWILAAIIMILIQLLLAHESVAAEMKETRFVISIIDTGIDLNNTKLSAQLCQNPGETGVDKNGKSKKTNGIDDDGNGFADDVHGWSFYDNTKDLQDNHGHGTHIASIIYQELALLKLETKFCFQILKYYDSDTFSPHLLQASNYSFVYALENGTQLVNYSGGGYTANKEEERLIRKLAQKNIPLMAAMGNQTINTDRFPFFPASYTAENIFAIGAAENTQEMAKFSNYGKKHFDFLAPGVHVRGSGLNNSETVLSGTSQATAKASAMLAYLIYQQNEKQDWTELKKTLKNLRSVYAAKNKKENPLFLETKFIQKYKTSQVDAFGEPIKDR